MLQNFTRWRILLILFLLCTIPKCLLWTLLLEVNNKQAHRYACNPMILTKPLPKPNKSSYVGNNWKGRLCKMSPKHTIWRYHIQGTFVSPQTIVQGLWTPVLSPPVQFAGWAHMYHFLPVCPLEKPERWQPSLSVFLPKAPPIILDFQQPVSLRLARDIFCHIIPSGFWSSTDSPVFRCGIKVCHTGFWIFNFSGGEDGNWRHDVTWRHMTWQMSNGSHRRA